MFGKFMPPTLGHAYAIEYALALTSKLVVIVGDRMAADVIPGALRREWLDRYLAGRASAVTVALPPLSWKLAPRLRFHTLKLQQSIADLFDGQRVDYVFGGEWYTLLMAHAVGAKPMPIGFGRGPIHLHARAVRADPQGRWNDILPPARPFFLRETILEVESKRLRRCFVAAQTGGLVVDVMRQLGGHPDMAHIHALAAASRAIADRSVTYLCSASIVPLLVVALDSPEMAVRRRYSAGVRILRIDTGADEGGGVVSAAAVASGQLPEWPLGGPGSPL